MDWLHFIGKSYYPTIGTFKNEADKYRVSRRISLLQLKRFDVGDRVFLFQWDKKKHASTLFGYFQVDTIYCAHSTPFVNANKKKSKQDEEVEEIKQEIIEAFCKRKCGEFNILEYLFINLAIDEIEKELEEYNCQKPMIGGKFHPLLPSQSQIHFQRGFRHFDYDKYVSYKASGKRAKDQYYVPNYGSEPASGKKKKGITMIFFENYKKAHEVKKDKLSN